MVWELSGDTVDGKRLSSISGGLGTPGEVGAYGHGATP